MNLRPWHHDHGGTGEPYPPTGCLVDRYGDVAAEFQAAHEGALLVDRSRCARLQLSGKDRRDLVQRLTTNELEKLPEGHGAPTVFINGKGKILDRVVLHAASDGDIMVGGADRAGALLDWMRGYIIREDVEMTDLTEATTQLELMGPRTLDILHAPLLGFSALHELMVVELGGVQVLANRTDPVAGVCIRMIVPTDLASTVVEHLLKRGARLGGGAAYNALRVEAGLPLTGPELNDERNPLEAGLVDAVHFNKGCYIGQEVVARVDTYMKQRRYLVGLELEGTPPAPGSPVLTAEGGEGEVTSCAPMFNGRSRALAYVKGADLTVGMQLTVTDDGVQRHATVVKRPAQQPAPKGGEGNQSAAVA
jgi:folate-binding protein YgfZ